MKQAEDPPEIVVTPASKAAALGMLKEMENDTAYGALTKWPVADGAPLTRKAAQAVSHHLNLLETALVLRGLPFTFSFVALT